LQGVGSVKNRGVQNKTVWVAAESFSQKFWNLLRSQKSQRN
jgi:hypothetical protein